MIRTLKSLLFRRPAVDPMFRPRLEMLERRELLATGLYATGAGAGGGPHVVVRDARNLVVASFYAYDPKFTGGVTVATGDVTGDGLPDVVTGAGPGGGPHVKVFDGAALAQGRVVEVRSFYAYDPAFRGGVNVAVGDVDGNATGDIVTGAGPGGGPHVKVFSGTTSSVLLSFYAYEATFAGGVRVAAANVDGDAEGAADGGHAEVITGAGPGGGPLVKVWGITGQPIAPLVPRLLASFFAFDQSFHGGVYVGGGFVTGTTHDGRRFDDVIVGAGEGGGPVYRVWTATGTPTADGLNLPKTVEASAFDPGLRTGLRVSGFRDINGDGREEIFVGLGPGVEAQVRVINAKTNEPLQTLSAYGETFTGGVFVAG